MGFGKRAVERDGDTTCSSTLKHDTRQRGHGGATGGSATAVARLRHDRGQYDHGGTMDSSTREARQAL